MVASSRSMKPSRRKPWAAIARAASKSAVVIDQPLIALDSRRCAPALRLFCARFWSLGRERHLPKGRAGMQVVPISATYLTRTYDKRRSRSRKRRVLRTRRVQLGPQITHLYMRDDYLRSALEVIDDPTVLINVVSRRVKQLRRGNRPL